MPRRIHKARCDYLEPAAPDRARRAYPNDLKSGDQPLDRIGAHGNDRQPITLKFGPEPRQAPKLFDANPTTGSQLKHQQ